MLAADQFIVLIESTGYSITPPLGLSEAQAGKSQYSLAFVNEKPVTTAVDIFNLYVGVGFEVFA